MTNNLFIQSPRAGCKDIWNAFMLQNASLSSNDIPFCPTTAITVPQKIVTFDEARATYNKATKLGDFDFFEDAFVCWYIDDQKFDNREGIWQKPFKAKKILEHFAGIITPDFSTCHDFPIPLKMFNTYRMRAFGYWYGTFPNHQVINNVRWGTRETFSYCFDGLPTNSIFAIGTVASGLCNQYNMLIFEEGLFELVNQLTPHTIIVYGSSKYKCFDSLRQQNISIVTFPSKTSIAFEGGVTNG